MRELFKAEFLRHWKWTTALGLGHFAVLHYMSLLGTSFAAMPVAQLWLMSVMVVAAAFGALQMRLYRRGNEWIYLLHRPLSHQRIFVALASAAVCQLVVILLAPASAMLILMHVDNQFGVELRHYQLIPYAGIAALVAYFCACFAVLSPSRLAVLALALPTVFVNVYDDAAMLAASMFVLLWSAYLAYVAFKPDLSRLFERPTTLVLTELPVQYGALWGLALLVVIFLELRAGVDGNDPYLSPEPGTAFHVLQLPPKDRLVFALERSGHPDAAYLKQQVALGEFSGVRIPQRYRGTERYQLPLADNKLTLTDPDTGVIWTFSHDAMLYEGRDIDSGRLIGWLGPKGFSAGSRPRPAAFTSIPWVTGNEFVIDERNVWQVDWERQRIHHRYASRRDGRFLDSLNVSESVTTLLSDAALYVFATDELRNAEIELAPRAVLETPAWENAGPHVLSVHALIDGYLVSALTNLPPTTIGADFALYGKSRLHVYRTHGDSGGESVASVPLDSGISSFFIYNTFVLSPGMRLMTDLMWGLILRKDVERTLPVPFVPFPARILWMAGLPCVLSGSLAAWLLRSSTFPAGTKVTWIALCAVLGPTGLLVFLLSVHWRGGNRAARRWSVPERAAGSKRTRAGVLEA